MLKEAVLRTGAWTRSARSPGGAAYPPKCWPSGCCYLLSTGLAQPSGLGDVHIYPTGGCVVIELRTQAPTARLVADRRALQAFLAAAASLVPPGTEIDHYTLDEELLRIQHGKKHRPDRAGVTPHRTVSRPAGFRSIANVERSARNETGPPVTCDPRGPLSSWGPIGPARQPVGVSLPPGMHHGRRPVVASGG